jgi:Ser/Thr protein kinase RdoA (MazF antagonist)
MSQETCFAIGSMMAKIHNVTATKRIDRVDYNAEVLMHQAYDKLNVFFSGDLDELKYLKQISSQIENRLEETAFSEDQKGIVHLDIWYDNLSVNKDNEIIIFDFDNCEMVL